jgi:hypothetical protein
MQHPLKISVRTAGLLVGLKSDSAAVSLDTLWATIDDINAREQEDVPVRAAKEAREKAEQAVLLCGQRCGRVMVPNTRASSGRDGFREIAQLDQSLGVEGAGRFVVVVQFPDGLHSGTSALATAPANKTFRPHRLAVGKAP